MQSRLLCLLYLATTSAQSYLDNVLQDGLELLRRGQRQMDLEAFDHRDQLLREYDFIVVGAGTAGCALAARLSENPDWQVLLLEAGGPESYIMDMPILAHYLQLGEMNWKYRTQPSNSYCLAMNNNRCNWPRGKVM
ncbi:glucose dehydrogenase [FAD, quinone]-like, partial [Drosophila navojoa]